MATLGDMQSRIADDLNRADLSTQIITAIQRSIRHYSKERFWFNEKTWSFSVSSATEVVAFSAANTTDLKLIDTVTLTRNSTDIYPMDQILYNDLRALNSSGSANSTNAPDSYAIFQNSWFFYPIPDQNYTVHVYGQKSYTTLSDTTTSNDFTVYAEDLIEAHARWWLYMRILKDPQNALLAQQEEALALGSLREKTSNLISTRRLKSNDY